MNLEHIFGIATAGELESFDKKNKLTYLTIIDDKLIHGLATAVGEVEKGNILIFDIQKKGISDYKGIVCPISLSENFAKIYSTASQHKRPGVEIILVDGLLLYSPADKYFNNTVRLKDYLSLIEKFVIENNISMIILDPYVAKSLALYMKSKYPKHTFYFYTNQVIDKERKEYDAALEKWRVFCENYDLFDDFIDTFAGLKENIFAEGANISRPSNRYKEFVLNSK